MQRSRGHQQLRRLRGRRDPRVVHGEVCERIRRVLEEEMIEIARERNLGGEREKVHESLNDPSSC